MREIGWAANPCRPVSVLPCNVHLLQHRFLMNSLYLFVFGIGVTAGLRALTPPAIVAWAAHFGWLNLNNSPLAFVGSTIAAVIFSLLAIFELIGDLRPQTA